MFSKVILFFKSASVITEGQTVQFNLIKSLYFSDKLFLISVQSYSFNISTVLQTKVDVTVNVSSIN